MCPHCLCPHCGLSVVHPRPVPPGRLCVRPLWERLFAFSRLDFIFGYMAFCSFRGQITLCVLTPVSGRVLRAGLWLPPSHVGTTVAPGVWTPKCWALCLSSSSRKMGAAVPFERCGNRSGEATAFPAIAELGARGWGLDAGLPHACIPTPARQGRAAGRAPRRPEWLQVWPTQLAPGLLPT